MNHLVLIGLLAVSVALVAPTAAAHFVVAFPNPTTGECTAKSVPGSEKFVHGSVSVFPCEYWHLP